MRDVPQMVVVLLGLGSLCLMSGWAPRGMVILLFPVCLLGLCISVWKQRGHSRQQQRGFEVLPLDSSKAADSTADKR